MPQRDLVAIQKKVGDDLHDSAVQCRAGTFRLKSLCWLFLCLPEPRDFLCETELSYCKSVNVQNRSTLKIVSEVTHCKSEYMTVIIAKLILPGQED